MTDIDIGEAARERSSLMGLLMWAPQWGELLEEAEAKGPDDEIAVAAAETLRQLLEEFGDDTHWGDHVLDVRLLRSPLDPDDWRCEFLLSCGGPTETVVVDSKQRYPLYTHSWGMLAGQRCQEWALVGKEAEPWVDAAEEVAEAWQAAE